MSYKDKTAHIMYLFCHTKTAHIYIYSAVYCSPFSFPQVGFDKLFQTKNYM